jgi:hypothetical protein
VGEENTSEPDPLQLILIKVIARAAVPLAEVQRVVGTRPKQIRAFNLLDGTLTLTDVAKKTGLGKPSLSRATQRWISAGVMYRLGPERAAKLLHVYPIPIPKKTRVQR